jgi:hypothetical protein
MSPRRLDARAMCQKLAEAIASSLELINDAYADQCMIARGHGAKSERRRSAGAASASKRDDL